MTTIPFKPIFPLLFLSFFFLNVAAQKLPNVQTGSVRAPANIKIDGKATEWNNSAQAYNRATEISYTVSNDDTMLYLTVQVLHRDIINKIMHGGITFTIQPSGRKTDKGGISVTYPLFDEKNRPFLPPVASGGGGDEIASIVPAGSADRVNDPKGFKSDSLMRLYNKSLTDNSKYIGVIGVKGLDTLISIYNADGIKVAESFDNQLHYTCELAIELKLLGLKVSDASKFTYHIALNPFSSFLATPEPLPVPAKGGGYMSVNDGLNGASSATTDMWGEYTLAKP